MRKIFCHSNGTYTYIDFYEYEFEEQLKEFAHLFTISSGMKILEYREGPGTTLVTTENSNSEVSILWDDMCGCCIYAPDKNKVELVKMCYKMLCNKYSGYHLFSELFDNIEINIGKTGFLKINLELLDGKKEFDDNKKNGILQDLNDLIFLISE